MFGSSSILALWLLAAVPAGSATASDDADDNLATPVAFQVPRPLERWAERREKEAPKPLSRTLAYEDRHLPPASSPDGIPGLPPLPDDTPAPPTGTAPAPKPPQKAAAAPSPQSTPPQATPRTPPQKTPTPPALLPQTPRPLSGDIGNASCGDRRGVSSCGEVYERPKRSGCFANWIDDVGYESWIDQGATINTLSPRNRINGPVTFNNRSNEYQLNQAYLRLKRDVNADDDVWQLGGRIDLLYGTDSFYTTARGLETFDDFAPKWNAQQYGLALPQAYAEFFVPWGNGLSMKMGHFYAPLGYETVTAPDNFFYSHSYVHQYGEPFTFTGLLGSTKVGNYTFRSGMTRGWDNWESDNNTLGFVGGATWENDSKRTSVALDITVDREQPNPSTDYRTLYSLVVQQKLGDLWQYVIQHDYATEPGAGVGGTTASWYGVNQYLYYTINDYWKAGMRFEWFRDQNGSRVPVLGGPQTGDYYELTAGVNWKPNDRVAVRPELRWDWTSTPGLYPFGDGTRSNQLLLDCDVIVRF
jgi:hypothetical protein